MKVEGTPGTWVVFDGTNPPAICGVYLVARVNTIERGGPPLIDLMMYGEGFFDDDTIDEAFYWPDSEWSDIPLDPNEVLAWMPLPTCNFDWQTLTDEYWERMHEWYGW